MTRPEDPPGFYEGLRVWGRIGLLSFGGPAAQIATMHRILVDEKRWLSEARFLHALNFCMLLPGPEAQQLATYGGWLLHRAWGGVVAGILFILPGFVMMMLLAGLYAGFKQAPVVAALFYGIKPAVLAVVVEALLRIGRRAFKHRLFPMIALAAFIAIFFLEVPFPLIILGAGLLGYAGARHGHPAFTSGSGGRAEDGEECRDAVVRDSPHLRPDSRRSLRVAMLCLVLWWGPVLAAYLAGFPVLVDIGLFFGKLAVVTFGGAYAVLAYVAQEVVAVHGWLSPGEMLDGLGLAETTPGPLILVNQFVGFLAGYRDPGGLGPWLGGLAGGAMAVWATFAPSFLWILVAGPYVEVLRSNVTLSGALAAITAAVVGVIGNLGIWFALHVLFSRVEERSTLGFRLVVPDPASLDPLALVLALAAAMAMLRFHLGMIPTLAASAVLGAAWRLWG